MMFLLFILLFIGSYVMISMLHNHKLNMVSIHMGNTISCVVFVCCFSSCISCVKNTGPATGIREIETVCDCVATIRAMCFLA